MLKDEDIQIECGRALHKGDFVCLTHVPTGISRKHPGPMRDINQAALFSSWIAEIEAELQAKGQTQYIIPTHRIRGKRKKQRAKRLDIICLPGVGDAS